MKIEVAAGIEDIKRQFPAAALTVQEDGQGGARVVMERVEIGPTFVPAITWLGFHIPAQYPYADIYPVFMSADVKRANSSQFVVPITAGHSFEGRPALQISRRSSAAQAGLQKASTKLLKVLDFLERLP